MNETVKRMVEIMFQDVEMTEEVSALRDEVLNNCQERFEDQMAAGKSEDEAIAAVAESLKGMEDVLAGYPQKERPAQGTACGESSNVFRFAPDAVREIIANLKRDDLRIVRGSEKDVVVRAQVASGSDIHASLEDGKLRISHEFRENERISRGWLTVIIASRSSSKVTIELPEGCAPALKLQIDNGDLTVQDVPIPEMRAESTCGDIRLETPECHVLRRVTIKTSSGDIQTRCAAEEMTLKSMSGDMRVTGRVIDAEASSISGDVHLDGDFEHVVMKSLSGDVCLNARNENLRKVTANSTSGDVDLNLRAKPEDVNAVCHSISGDVRSAYYGGNAGSRIQVSASSISGDVRLR